MSERLKILPLLIIVAMLAFSVRLVEVVGGVRDLSGSAQAAAENNVVENPPAMPSEEKLAMSETPDEAELAPEAGATDEAASTDNAKEGAASTAAGEEAVDTSKWRDASESDIDTSSVSMEMFEDMAKRRKELDNREQSLITREALLKAAEQELDQKYKEMEALRIQIEELLKEQSEEEKARITSLVKIYEGMKPAEAARIFNTLDLDILVSVVSQMSERKLSPVLASMEPERARTVTIMLAEQKTLPSLPE